MTVLEDIVAISMQNSRKTIDTNTHQQQCLKKTNETLPTKSYFEMTFASSDENSREQGTTASTSNANSGNKPGSSSGNSNSKGMSKKVGKRPGRKPAKIDERAKLERSRQSAKECRARKKLRYQYLEELVLNREKAVLALRDELELYKSWCHDVDQRKVPDELKDKVASEEEKESASSPLYSCPEGIVDFTSELNITDTHKNEG